jgi:hypothetical protein
MLLQNLDMHRAIRMRIEQPLGAIEMKMTIQKISDPKHKNLKGVSHQN